MQLHLNGLTQDIPLPDGAALIELIAFLNLNPDQIIVEKNADLLKKESFSATLIKDGDTLEILHFIGGGNFNFML